MFTYNVYNIFKNSTSKILYKQYYILPHSFRPNIK